MIKVNIGCIVTKTIGDKSTQITLGLDEINQLLEQIDKLSRLTVKRVKVRCRNVK